MTGGQTVETLLQVGARPWHTLVAWPAPGGIRWPCLVGAFRRRP